MLRLSASPGVDCLLLRVSQLDRDFCWRLCQSECKGVTAGDQGSGGAVHCVTAKLPSDVLQAVRFR